MDNQPKLDDRVYHLRHGHYLSVPEQPVVLHVMDPQDDTPFHTHDFNEIAIVLRGTGIHYLKQESWPVSAGDVFVLEGSLPHAYRNVTDFAVANLIYMPEYLAPLFAPLRSLPGFHTLFILEPAYRQQHNFRSRLHLTGGDFVQAERFVDAIRREQEMAQPGVHPAVVHYFMLLVIHLCRCYEQHDNSDAASLIRLSNVISYLERCYMEDIRISDLARKACLSKGAFHRAFRKATGVSPIAYLNQLRIRHACNYLRTSDKSITDIGFEVGFQDSNYFCRQFRKIMTITPSQYRSIYRKEI
ncbi:MAG: helix-turn-helix domain-containing protein [Lentisphaerae bacterium]|nr:MAG: helix-turn-helix domain-containing protein [Lentisphaerota bacterium]